MLPKPIVEQELDTTLNRLPKELKKFWKPSQRKSTIGSKLSDDTVPDETLIPSAIPSAEGSRMGTPAHDVDMVPVSSQAKVLDPADAGVAASTSGAAQLTGKEKAAKKHAGDKRREETLPAVENPGQAITTVREGSDMAMNADQAVSVSPDTVAAPEAMEATATASASESTAEATRPKKAKVAKKRKKPIADGDDIDAIFAGM